MEKITFGTLNSNIKTLITYIAECIKSKQTNLKSVRQTFEAILRGGRSED